MNKRLEHLKPLVIRSLDGGPEHKPREKIYDQDIDMAIVRDNAGRPLPIADVTPNLRCDIGPRIRETLTMAGPI